LRTFIERECARDQRDFAMGSGKLKQTKINWYSIKNK